MHICFRRVRRALLVCAALPILCAVSCTDSTSGAREDGGPTATTDGTGVPWSDVSSDATSEDTPVPESDAGALETSDSEASTGGGACTGPGYGSVSPSSVTVGTITATVLDVSDGAVTGHAVFVCGIDLCSSPATTGPDGSVSVGGGGHGYKEPAFKFGDGLAYGQFAIPLAAGATAMGTVHTARLPTTGAALAPGSAPESGPLTLTIAAGAAVLIDTLTYETADSQMLRIAELPIAKASVEPALGLERVFAAAPLATTICPPAKARIANTAGWPAGAGVEVYVHGLDVGEGFAPFGGWAKVSDAQVTSDGAAIETSEGGGLPLLTTFAIKRKP